MDRSTTILAFIGGLIAALLVVLIVVLLSGDDGGDDVAATTSSVETTEATAPPTSAAPSTTAAPATTTTAAPATTAAPTTTAATTTTLDVCAPFSSTPLPPGATEITSAIGDVDGDGAPDQAIVYRNGATWYVHVDLGNDAFGIETTFEPFNPGGSPAMEAVVDVGVSEEVILVNTGFGLPGPVFSVWFVADCQVFEATHDGGELTLWQGIGANHSENFGCTASGITFYEAYDPGGDPNDWEVRETPYDWVPGLGDFQSQAPTITPMTKDAALAYVGAATC